MKTLFVLYDARCDLCCRIRGWLQMQNKYVDLAFFPAGSEIAVRRFPHLDHPATLKELTVVADNGNVYRGAKAWVMCLWALREYRTWSLQLASPELMPMARRFIVWISQNRFRFKKFNGYLWKQP